jgi:hypothetical protein
MKNSLMEYLSTKWIFTSIIRTVLLIIHLEGSQMLNPRNAVEVVIIFSII